MFLIWNIVKIVWYTIFLIVIIRNFKVIDFSNKFVHSTQFEAELFNGKRRLRDSKW